VGTYLEQGKLGLEGWEVGIYQRMRVGDLGDKPKTELFELSFCEQIVGGLAVG